MNISIANETANDLIIYIPHTTDEVIILSGTKKEISCDTKLVSFSVKEQEAKFSNIQKIFSYVAGAIIGVFLCLIYYSQIEMLKNSIKFPVTFLCRT